MTDIILQPKTKKAVPRRRQFLSAEDLSFLEKKESLQQSSVIDTVDSSGNVINEDLSNTESKQSGIPIKINTVIAAQFSKLKKDAQLKENIKRENKISETADTTTTVSQKVTELGREQMTVRPTPSSQASRTLPFKTDAKWLIEKSDLAAIVSQDPTIRTLVQITTQKFTQTSSAQPSTPHTKQTTVAEKFTSPISTSLNPTTPAETSTAVTSPDKTVSLSTVLHRTPSDIPLMVGGGLALFIILLLVAIVVLLIRIKNRKGDVSIRHEGSNRSNVSRDTENTLDMKQINASNSRRGSKDSNIYSEIGSEVREDDFDEDEDDDDVIYYWGESEWDSESRHNSVLSLSYTTKTESGRNSTASGTRLSALGVPKRGRRKSSLLSQGRSPGGSTDLYINRQSNAGVIFCIPEGEDMPIDNRKQIEVKKDGLYKKVLKEKRSQSLF